MESLKTGDRVRITPGSPHEWHIGTVTSTDPNADVDAALWSDGAPAQRVVAVRLDGMDDDLMFEPSELVPVAGGSIHIIFVDDGEVDLDVEDSTWLRDAENRQRLIGFLRRWADQLEDG